MDANSQTQKTEHVYILIEREMIRLNEPTIKIGKTTRLVSERLQEYPKESKLLGEIYVSDCHSVEQCLIKVFKTKFTQATKYGTEYFNGNIGDMIRTFYMVASMFITDEFAQKFAFDVTSVCLQTNDLSNITNDSINTNKNSTDSNLSVNLKITQFIHNIQHTRPDWYLEGEWVQRKLLAEKYFDLCGDIPHSIFTLLKGRLYDSEKRGTSTTTKSGRDFYVKLLLLSNIT